MLDESLIGNVNLSIDTFTKMPNLRFLKIHSSSRKKSIKVNVPFGLERFCDRLKYFYWDNYPLESLPVSIFLSKDLVEIHMKNSIFRTLWKGVQVLYTNTQIFHCSHLIKKRVFYHLMIPL